MAHPDLRLRVRAGVMGPGRASARSLRSLTTATAAVALLLVGCGDGSDDATEEVSTVTIDLLEGAEAAGTARIALSMDGPQVYGPGQELDASMHLEGVVDLESGDHDVAGEVSTQRLLPEGSVDDPAPAVTFTMGDRKVGGRTFTRWAEDGSWTEEPSASDVEEVVVGEDGVTEPPPTDTTEPEVVEDDGDHALQMLVSLEEIDPVAVLEQVRDVARTVTEEGRGDVRGTEATHFRAVVDEEVVDDLALGPDAEPVIDIWVDDEDRLRRLEIDQMRVDLWDFGVAVDVQPPGDVVDWGSDDASALGPFALPTRSGDWALQAGGGSSIGPWEVWSAPYEVAGRPLTCRTFEAGNAAEPPSYGPMDPWPNREGVPAWCGYGVDWLSFSVPTLRPSLQAFVASTWSDASGREIPLVGLVVDERWSDSPIRVVRDGAPDVELSVGSGGVATWEPDGPAEPTEIRLAGGEVVCDLVTFDEQVAFDQEEHDDGGLDPGADEDVEEFPFVLSISGCVRA